MDAERRAIEDGPDRPRRWLWLLILVAVVPLAGATIRMAHAGWIPEGDDAMIARRSMSVFSTDPPTTGQPSTSGNLFTHTGGRTEAASIDASHPGPLEYYVLALPYRLGGWSPLALLASVLLVNGAAAAGTVWLAWRRLGTVGAAAGAMAVLVVAMRLGSYNLARPLNAAILVLPLLCGMVAAWGALEDDDVALVPAVAALSFVVQAHLGGAPFAALLLAVVLGRSAWRWRRARPWVLVGGVAVLALTWLPVAIDQVTGHPGNISRLVDVARLHPDRAGIGFALRAVLTSVGHPAWPGMAPIARIAIIGPLSNGLTALGGLVVVAVLGLGAIRGWSRARPELRPLVAIVGGWLLVTTAVLARGPDEVRLGPAYLLDALVAGEAILVVLGACSVLDLVGRRLKRVTSVGAVPVAIGLLAIVALVAATKGGPTYRADSARNRKLAAAIRAKVPKGTYLLSARGNFAYLSTLDAVSVDLLRHGYDIRLVRLGKLPSEPQRRDTDVDVPTIVLDESGEIPTGATRIVRLGPSGDDLSWSGKLDRALRSPRVHLRVDEPVVRAGGPDACLSVAAALAEAAPTPHQPLRVAHAILDCPQRQRRQVMSQIRFVGLDRFWVDELNSSMIAPYPASPVSAYLLPKRGSS
jgi:hypothetical protein